jgi:hypothetical protein
VKDGTSLVRQATSSVSIRNVFRGVNSYRPTEIVFIVKYSKKAILMEI